MLNIVHISTNRTNNRIFTETRDEVIARFWTQERLRRLPADLHALRSEFETTDLHRRACEILWRYPNVALTPSVLAELFMCMHDLWHNSDGIRNFEARIASLIRSEAARAELRYLSNVFQWGIALPSFTVIAESEHFAVNKECRIALLLVKNVLSLANYFIRHATAFPTEYARFRADFERVFQVHRGATTLSHTVFARALAAHLLPALPPPRDVRKRKRGVPDRLRLALGGHPQAIVSQFMSRAAPLLLLRMHSAHPAAEDTAPE